MELVVQWKTLCLEQWNQKKTSVRTFEEFANTPNLVISSNYLPISDMLVESPQVVATHHLFLKHYIYINYTAKKGQKRSWVFQALSW